MPTRAAIAASNAAGAFWRPRSCRKSRLIDLRSRPAGARAWLLSTLVKAIEANARLAKEQSLLFLNRRGYAPLTLCRSCGHRFQCPNCSAWLVDHRFRGQLVCHHCGHTERRPHQCPICHQPRTASSPAGPASSAWPRK
jgi:primosomal protein N' (replication factor Y)